SGRHRMRSAAWPARSARARSWLPPACRSCPASRAPASTMRHSPPRPGASAFRCCSPPRPAAAARACGWCASRRRSPTRWRRRAALADVALAAAGGRIGFPLLIKASAGGGGKGMRLVREPAALADALAAARREALRAFGDDTLLVERYFDAPRHIEVQIFGDTH